MVEDRPETIDAEASTTDVPELAKRFEEVVSDLSGYARAQRRNFDARHNIWPGQSDDNRKHSRAGIKAFPWEGASDLKVPLCDEIINMAVSQLCLALAKANLRAVPVEANDMQRSNVVSQFLRWLVLSQIKELPRESELLANYVEERGVGVIGIFWEEGVSLTQERLTLEQIAQQFPEIATAIVSGVADDEIATLMAGTSKVSKKKAKRMVKDLRNDGEAFFPRRQETKGRPVIRAYSVGDDLFIPRNVTCLQDSSVIFKRSRLTATQLREKEHTEGWDKDWIEDVLEAGPKDVPPESAGAIDPVVTLGEVAPSSSDTNDGVEELYTVIHAYRRLSDEDGIPGIYCTIFCPDYKEKEAKHYLLDYRHGMYPFVEFRREERSPMMLDSRGVPEIAAVWQDALKVEMDARIDGSSISTCPPLMHPTGREPTGWRPGGLIGERRPGEYHFADIPPLPQASIEIQGRIENMALKYFGRFDGQEYMVEGQSKQQMAINRWLLSWVKVFEQVWEIYKQYGPDEEYFRVIGALSNAPQKFAKGDPGEKFDLYLTFDVLNQDPEMFLTKIEKIATLAAQWDRYGMTDTAELLKLAFESIDPIIAERVLTPQDVSVQREVKEEQDDLVKIASGIDVDVPTNAAHQIRLQVAQSYIQGSQEIPATDVQQRLNSDEAFRARFEKHIKQLEFALQQKQNAQIGRLGTAPATPVTSGGMQ